MKKPNAKKRARVTQKVKKTDLLWQLTEICKGPVRLIINKHRDSYLTTEGALLQMRNRSMLIDAELEKEMIAKDCIIELHFYPVDVEGGYRYFGTNLVTMLQQAIAIAQVDTGVEDIFATYIEKEINCTDAVLRMMEVVKCSINFSVNEHRLISGGTAESYLAQLKEFDPEIEKQVGSQTWNAMIACDRVMEIHIYPSTPIGSYSTMNMNIQPIMVEFLKLAENEHVSNTVAIQADAAKDYIGLVHSK